MSRDDEDRWIDRTASDPDFADAVWSGRAPVEDAPAWYPRLVGLLGGVRNRPPPGDAEVARRGAVWAEVQRRARRQRRRRRALVVGAAAMGAALAAGAAAAASDGGLSLPFVGWESGAGRSTVGGDAGDPARRVPAVPAVEAEAVVVVEASEGRAPVAGTGGQPPGGRGEQLGAGCVPPGGRELARDAVPLAVTCGPGAVTSPDHSTRQRPSGVGRSANRAATTPPGDRPAPRAEGRPGQRGEDRRPVPAGAPAPVDAPPPLDAPPPAVDDAGDGSASRRRRAPAQTDAGARHP